MNTITDLLDLEDSELFISDVLVEGTRKLITLETHPVPHFCPSCGYRMHSRGIKTRTVQQSSNSSGRLRADPPLETTSLALYQS